MMKCKRINIGGSSRNINYASFAIDGSARKKITIFAYTQP